MEELIFKAVESGSIALVFAGMLALIVKGWLVPRGTVDQLCCEHDEHRNDMKTLYEAQIATYKLLIAEKDAQIGLLTKSQQMGLEYALLTQTVQDRAARIAAKIGGDNDGTAVE